MSEDITALSYWFPKLLAAGLPVPHTTILKMPEGVQKGIWSAFDGKGDDGDDPSAFHAQIDAAAQAFGYPCFLRTDMTSGKHNWKDTCFLPDAASIPQHVFNICEYSECADLIGIRWDTWAVREMLPTIPFGVCPYYGDMPICREFRFFVDGAAFVCGHPYWPKSALIDGGINPDRFDYAAVSEVPTAKLKEIADIACAAGRALGGAWSIDILETTRGWFVTDCAESHKSFHWEGCEHADSFRRRCS